MNTHLAMGIAAVLSFLVAFGLGYIVIPWLHKLKFGQTILEIGPRWHKNKEGTPTMGGILFIIGTLLSFVIVFLLSRMMGKNLIEEGLVETGQINVKIWGGLLMALGFGAVGFADDYVKVVKKRNLGLTIKQKTIAQVLIILGYLGSLYAAGATYMFVPFVGNIDMGYFFWFFGVFVIYCTVNAVNFTDGIDGLCGSVTLTAAVGFLIAAAMRNYLGVSVLAAALAGGCGGYLIWNWNPSKVIMGDIGALFLGGMIVAFAYAVDCPLLILPIGIIYVIEFASDIIQISYFKATGGKRVFKMAPIHHHFEMCGWKEKKIVKVFTTINIIGCIAGILLVYFGNPK